MAERHMHIADDTDAGIRLDALLGDLGPIASRSAAVKLIEADRVLVNGETQSKSYLVSEGDLITYTVDEPRLPSIMPEYLPLDIRFEDEYLIVLSKQAGLVCHPSVGHESGTLVNALIAHCGIENLGTLQGEDRPGIVHRLDKDTSGLMLAAKDDQTQAALQDAIRVRSVDRRYLSLVHGYIAPDTGLIDAPIARGERERMRMEVSDDEDARGSVTTFTVLERFDAGRFDDGYTFLECHLYTGRTHQIRVHMNYIGHPVVGDQLYGNCRLKADMDLKRQFLHSYSLRFDHPRTGEHLSFLDPLPDDLLERLERLDGRSMGRTEAGEKTMAALAHEREKQER